MKCSAIVLPADRPRRMGSLVRRAPMTAGVGIAAIWFVLTGAAARAQAPKPFVPDITERSGLLMRFAATPEILPPDKHRDKFYNTRYADKGPVNCPNWYATQGLYGLGMKTPATESVYPFFYGMPRQSTVDSSSRPWWRPLRFFQGLAHPFRPVGMYYQMGSYVPIYDLDPVVPGPGPYPYPFYFNWVHGG
ncbi:MAG TPA: hypothetical protein VKA15_04190 [Isosphaeraceae bacterium]|nr:hypothetical protein [Isosphaeraceae bacterium]